MEKNIQQPEIYSAENSRNTKKPKKNGSKVIYKACELKKIEDKSIDLSELLAEFKENLLFMFLM